MQLLALLHRWAGGIAGLLLAMIGLSGVLLMWEDAWIMLPGADEPVRNDATQIGMAVAGAMSASTSPLSRLTLAGDGFGLHQAIYNDGSGAYLTQDGLIVDQWRSLWERPELWLFDLHHHLFLGDTGKLITGILGLLLLAFTISGTILWWRTRKTFKFRLWPARMSRPAIVWQHRDIGIVASPLLIVLALTGTLMVFKPLSTALLFPLSEPQKPRPDLPHAHSAPGPDTNWALIVKDAEALFPGATARRFQFPREAGAPLTLRLKQAEEWTPNGRTYVYFDPATATILGVQDPFQGDAASLIEEKYYPVHAAKVGGIVWRIALTFAGLALTLLGTLACWTFWFKSPSLRPIRAAR
ncbi:peptidase [Croceicoccus estronivorus]|uniref:PepSY-associated TM helix domain-containing protein n=1 Tax=Croceicoccus estronivorus TaxID=1172626 RepID=UPI000831A163|nr:PepSY-associated TM helix domain-containing protein [Croceicoccus estronivorus]OCC22569.1 peptidase [Croceicoccus estronivorus]